MKKSILILLCVMLSFASLRAQTRTSWDAAGITLPLADGLKVVASSGNMLSAKGGGIDLKIRTMSGDAIHSVVLALTERVETIVSDFEKGEFTASEPVPVIFFEYLKERGYNPRGHSREVFLPVNYGIVGYFSECEDAEDNVLAGVFYIRHKQIPVFMVVRFDPGRGADVVSMLLQASAVD